MSADAMVLFLEAASALLKTIDNKMHNIAFFMDNPPVIDNAIQGIKSQKTLLIK